MAKNNARTFRYSDEVAAILQQHNNDFDALVLECFYKLPEVRKEVERAEEEISCLRKEYMSLFSKTRDLGRIYQALSSIERRLDVLKEEIEEM